MASIGGDIYSDIYDSFLARTGSCKFHTPYFLDGGSFIDLYSRLTSIAPNGTVLTIISMPLGPYTSRIYSERDLAPYFFAPPPSSSKPSESRMVLVGLKSASSSASRAEKMVVTQDLSSWEPRPQTYLSSISPENGGCVQRFRDSGFTGTT